MQLKYLQTYSKGLFRVDNVLVAVHQIVQTAPVFTDHVNMSVNKPLEIKALREVTLVNGSKHYVSSEFLSELIVVSSPYCLSEAE